MWPRETVGALLRAVGRAKASVSSERAVATEKKLNTIVAYMDFRTMKNRKWMYRHL